MKKLKSDIEKRLIDAGFSKLPDKPKPDSTTDTKGANAPFFVLGDFAENLITIELHGSPSANSRDIGIAALNFSNETHFLHAIRDKKRSRVPGQKIFKDVLICEYKPVKQNDDEEII